MAGGGRDGAAAGGGASDASGAEMSPKVGMIRDEGRDVAGS